MLPSSGDTASDRSAPAFTATALSGRAINFPADYAGKIVLLDFWATWCPPCRAEIPNLVAARQRYRGQGFEILGVTLDATQRVSNTTVVKFATKQKMNWEQVYRDAARIAGAYGVTGIPTAFLIDGDSGAVLATGPDVHGDALLRTIEKNLKKHR